MNSFIKPTVILHHDRNIVRTYAYAYGIGLESKKIYPYFFSRYNTQDSLYGYFPLELDINRDSCSFCLVGKDMSIDTVSFRYKRRIYADRECEGAYPFNAAFRYLSSALKKDSCYINTYYYEGEVVLVK